MSADIRPAALADGRGVNDIKQSLSGIPIYTEDATLLSRCLASLFRKALEEVTEKESTFIPLLQKVFPFLKREDFGQFDIAQKTRHLFFQITLVAHDFKFLAETPQYADSQAVLHSLHRLLVQKRPQNADELNLENAPELLCAAAILNLLEGVFHLIHQMLTHLQPDPAQPQRNTAINRSLLCALFATCHPGSEELFTELLNSRNDLLLRFPLQRPPLPGLPAFDDHNLLSIAHVFERAAETGATKNLTSILQHISDQEFRDPAFRNHLFDVLNRAAKRGDIDVVRILLEDEKIGNFDEFFTGTWRGLSKALTRAAEQGHYAVVKLILDDPRSIRIPATAGWGETGLCDAMRSALLNRQWNVAKLLFSAVNKRSVSERFWIGLKLALFMFFRPLVLLISLIIDRKR